MRKTEKCYHYFIGISILLGILYVSVFIRLHSGFEYPSENELFNLLMNSQYPILVGFVLSTSITITLKSILGDLEWTLASLKSKIKELDKNL